MKAFANMTGEQGMDLRDYFAAKAMEAIIIGGAQDGIVDYDDMVVATNAYLIADHMMKAREGK